MTSMKHERYRKIIMTVSKIVILATTFFSLSITTRAQSIASAQAQPFVTSKFSAGAFPIVTAGPASASSPAAIFVSPQDDWLVHQAASLLQHDIEMVSGRKPEIISSMPASGNIIVIGTIDGCKWIDSLSASRRMNLDSMRGKWEAFTLATIAAPAKGARSILLIAGSDKRGAAYGVFELSRQIGVSPWYWWADVPAKQQKELYVKKGVYRYGSPSVKYRGIFINDEAPAFSGWTKEKFGGANHLVYEKIFELLLRLKANYLWPAMWGNAFNDDDTLNPVLADKWGIVMGTSHHEPMLRAQQEWKRYGHGPWDYTTNDSTLRAFWKQGIRNMGRHESIVTIGMRGDGDKPMTEGTATRLLENIVADQRHIIEEVTGRPASQTPQDWALYKEVQDYYDKGMRVPDDVTLLLCDDNWGNIRRLPKLSDAPRAGGYGIYYHFDYVGGPRNYKWLNTNNIARVWEQMHLAYAYGVRQIWIVNVGDLKPMEFPISFFLDYAWNVNSCNETSLPGYFTRWSAEQFGPAHATAIGRIIQKYAQYNARRKPELLDARTYSIDHYNEAARVTADWDTLVAQAEKFGDELPATCRDAYFELVLHPVRACANLQHLYTAVALNHRFAQENNPVANKYADSAKQYYLDDSVLSNEYNHLAGGKWDHMMDQTHIGYTWWQEPRRQKMPEVEYVRQDTLVRQTGIVSITAASVTKDSPKHRLAIIPADAAPNSFYERKGYLSIEAAHYTRRSASSGVEWKVIPGIGRDGDGITTFPVTKAFPVTRASQPGSPTSPRLEYDFYTYDTGSFRLDAYFSPTLNIHHDSAGLRYAISIDDGQPQIVSVNKNDNDGRLWNKWVADDIIVSTTVHSSQKKGQHVIKYWAVDPGVILQKLIADFGGLQPSYLGPPETIIHKKTN
ncbi:MAG TPA: glycosyl hydrolase 115 family protein [Puia sp.]